MARNKPHAEVHATARIGWLRAAVLGANDGIISTAGLVVGVAAASTDHNAPVVSGVAGLVAGALSMAAGEYVSVSSQADAENADLARERRELAETPDMELRELEDIYITRGLAPDLARQVALQLTAKDALGAHARDELGISEATEARPVQAALASAVTFSAGAALPLGVTMLTPEPDIEIAVGIATLAALLLLGYLGAWAGRAKPLRPVIRVVFWGVAALAVTAGVGRLFGAAV
jgi:VIT1/CCC1 family predicted Fe2+/Mn2+ transporter